MDRDSPCGDFLLIQRSSEVIDHDEGACLINPLTNAPLETNKWSPVGQY